MNNVKSVLQFTNYQIDELTFKINPRFDKTEIEDIDIEFSINHLFDESDKGKLILFVNSKLFNDDFNEGIPYYLNLKVAGFFNIENYDESEKQQKILLANTLAILFPYIRSIITTISTTANIPSVILPPINTYKLIEDAKKTTL